MQYIDSKRWQLSTRLHGITRQKIIISVFTATRHKPRNHSNYKPGTSFINHSLSHSPTKILVLNQLHVSQTHVVLILTLILLMWRIGWAPNSIPIYIQQDVTLHSLFISGNCSTCFGCYFHLSSGAHTTVSTAPGICHTVTAICRYRGIVGTGLSVLWVAYATHSTLKPVRLFHDSGRYQ